ncbi:MAG: tRNA (cytidine(56)-2'-O)-methyltransferase [Nitrososphaerota archaeon]
MQRVTVLRLGHRIKRDQRITTHVALTARALGVDEIIFTGEKDDILISSINRVVEKWGGKFKIRYSNSWKEIISNAKSHGDYIVHLTMYGANLPEVLDEIKENFKRRNLLVIVGGAKVPAEIYRLADINVAITNQPHSEVAALALFLRDLIGNSVYNQKFPDAKITIHPSRAGKAAKKN